MQRVYLAIFTLGFATLGCKTKNPAQNSARETTLDQTEKPALLPPNHLQRLLRGENGARFIATPLIHQSRNFTCGAASLESVLLYWGDNLAEGKLQSLLRSDSENGTAYMRMIRLVEKLNDPKLRETILNETLAPDETGGVAVSQLPDDSDEIAATTGAFRKARKLRRQASQGQYTMNLFVNRTFYQGDGKDLPGCPAVAPKAINGPEQHNGLSLDRLKKYINDGQPVIVVMQAWAEYPLEKYRTSFDSGHYAVVTGYDAKNIYFMDPYTPGNYAFLPAEDFEARWHDYDGALSTGDEWLPCGGGYKLERFALVIRKEKTATGFRADDVTNMP